MNNPGYQAQIGDLLVQARTIAVKYYGLTGKPLGITGEIGEYEAARLLNLELAEARRSGFDAKDRSGRLIQIKSRSLHRSDKRSGHRVGRIDLTKEWDAVVLVIMDERYMPVAIYEAGRTEIEDALSRPGSKARNERGQLSVTKFKAIGRLVWQERTDTG